MTPTAISISRPAITKLLLATSLMLGLLGLFVALAADASAGGDIKVTVNSTANVDDGACEGAPNEGTGNCTLHEAIDAVNDGNADIINFHPPVFSKEQPGVINVCRDEGEGNLPVIKRDIVIDSENSGVILDGGLEDGDCADRAWHGIRVVAESNGLDFELNGGKNFTVRNVCAGVSGGGIWVSGFGAEDVSLGTIEITGVTVENVCDEAIRIEGTNLESGSVTNSDISSTYRAGVTVEINACDDEDLDCKLTDSMLDISGNRIQGGTDDTNDGVTVEYEGRINSGTKITVGVTQNEVINGTEEGVDVVFDGCGSGGFNVHVDENEEINGEDGDGVRIDVMAGECTKERYAGALAGGHIIVPDGDTSDSLEVVVTVNGNGDIENHNEDDEGVDISVRICCEESDSSATVEVNDNGRVTGEYDGIYVSTFVCCGDDNVSNVSVNGNDEVTGEDGAGIEVETWAGSAFFASHGGVAGSPTGFDGDDNVCTITIDGNNEIDGVGWHGVVAECFAGTFGSFGPGGAQIAGPPPLSSGDGNVSTIIVTNNSDIDGDDDGINAEAIAGSIDGEADDNLTEVIVSGNGEITGDGGDGIEIDTGSGTPIDEGDDNSSVVTIEENNEIGGNGSDGIDVDSFAGGITDGSEGNSTEVTIVQNGTIEGSGEGDDGIELDSIVCCDTDNANTITISNNKEEITGHDGSGIDIETCCSVNTITIMDNEGNIRGGDDDGLELGICGVDSGIVFPLAGVAGVGEAATAPGFSFEEYVDCLKSAVTNLQVMNNSFSDSEKDGIDIEPGVFEDEDLEIKSVISNNVIEGNGDDGIDIESASGLNIGPGNEIFENGTSNSTFDDEGDDSRNDAGDSGIEIDWFLATCAWWQLDNKLPANHNTITQNSIYDNFSLGIDLVGYDAEGDDEFFGAACADVPGGQDDEGRVGCVPFPETAISPNDCIPFPDLETQSGDKLIGTACSECIVEVFWADNDPSNNDGHGEGAEYIVSGEADEDGDFSIDLPCDLGAGDLTATATDKLKNTSEFAANLTTLGTGSCATDTPVPPDETDTPVPPDPTATPEPTKTCGDVNMDGSVNSVDATLILQLKAGLIDSVANESSADVDNDGNVTSIDASLILQATAGLIDESALDCG